MPHSYKLFASIKNTVEGHILPKYFPKFLDHYYDREESEEKNKSLREKIASEYIQPVLHSYWRVKTCHYPIKHCIGRGFSKSKRTIKVMVDKCPKKDPTDKKKNDQDNTEKKNPTLTGELPLEIWNDIIMMGADPKVLIRINKQFYHSIAPRLYKKFEKLQLLLILTKTDKIKANDSNFLKYGPDYPHKPCVNGYKIYERLQEGIKHEFEFLEVIPKTAQFAEIFLGPIHKEIKKKTNTILISSFNDIEFLFENILNNDESVLKHMIKNISMDISIFDGFEQVMYTPGKIQGSELSIDDLIKSIIDKRKKQPENTEIEMFQSETNGLCVTNHNDNFKGCRWKQEPDGNLRTRYIYETERGSFYKRHMNNQKFPLNVYFMELLHIYQCYQIYLDDERIKFENIKSNEELYQQTPFRDIYDEIFTVDEIADSCIEYGSRSLLTFEKCSRMKIPHRCFKTEDETFKKLNNIICLMLNEDKISTSLLFNGICTTQERVDPSLDNICLNRCGYLSAYKGISTLVINKHN
ncbi:hypothetical protein BN7_3581 [Wickerhamomyces ciferrii]|uniref:F-box domain-containing protein n=1 Tax=Wickerhamomyces ciferrii (strain ATCC 14091 / BCRC 22168 / CBS 111 / JCM 3599 / NBRC 0793 / NRRL Y-1031 F-60-10) TaxID=1206466 RepID=K0KRS0_WICCF|nr:uncharacterized protein BN7_3581 [Wickerhamomyces ciferrii]CCH44024.1 hypothetical protein BN7_3581 [Wickerhamomyces ciferrii]